MYKYLLKHENETREKLAKEEDLDELFVYHNRQIQWMQHERLIHLLVTLFTGFMFLVFTAAAFITQSIIIYGIFLTIAILLFFYVMHYFRLENGVQRWYVISNSIYEKTRSKHQ